MLNRSAMVVRPMQPYVDWARGLEDSGPLPSTEGEGTVYLGPEITTGNWEERILREVFAEVFEAELYAWHTVPADWPEPRTLGMFKEWFKLEFHSIVIDLCSRPLTDDAEVG